MLLSNFLTYGLFAASAVASPANLMRRGDKIGHDKVVEFGEKVPSGVEGDLMKKHKPYLKVFNGCVPFPAVDAAGNYGGGLKETGSTNGGCSKSTGQVYARAGSGKDGTFGIMYSWYFPKDSPSPGTGHRHDWEEIVVWLASKSASAKIRGVAYSAHGGFSKTINPPLKDSRPLVGYSSPGTNHALLKTNEVGGEQPLIAWDSMTSEARKTLETVSFGDASAKFVNKENTFKNRLEESFVTDSNSDEPGDFPN